MTHTPATRVALVDGLLSYADKHPATWAADEAKALLREAAAALARPADGWLPIESAPKDGTLYLCWVDAIRYGESDDGSQYQADVSEVDFGQWRDFETGGAHMNMMGDIGDGQQITHWMPLPTPPASDTAAIGHDDDAYQKGFRDGYERRHMEVLGALA